MKDDETDLDAVAGVLAWHLAGWAYRQLLAGLTARELAALTNLLHAATQKDPVVPFDRLVYRSKRSQVAEVATGWLPYGAAATVVAHIRKKLGNDSIETHDGLGWSLGPCRALMGAAL